MKLSETVVVSKGFRIFELIWRGFYFRSKDAWKKPTRERFKIHSEKCFYHAHRLFRKHNKQQNLGWQEWEISIVEPVKNSSFLFKDCAFKITKVDK